MKINLTEAKNIIIRKVNKFKHELLFLLLFSIYLIIELLASNYHQKVSYWSISRFLFDFVFYFVYTVVVYYRGFKLLNYKIYN